MSATKESIQKRQPAEQRKSGRLSVRVDATTKEVLERAALLEGVSVSAFVLNHAVQVARDIVDEHEHIHLSEQDRDLFLHLLDNPPAPADALRRAAERYREQVQES